jgi:hypothetical protein
VEADHSVLASAASVTSAIAAEASRAERPGAPAMGLNAIEPDTSSASSVRPPLGVTVPNAR